MNDARHTTAQAGQRKTGRAALGATFVLAFAAFLGSFAQLTSPVAQAEPKAVPAAVDLASSHDHIKPAPNEAPAYEYH